MITITNTKKIIMKKFKDFQETRQRMSAQEFEASTNSSVETQDFREGNELPTTSINVYVYLDYYYIDIFDVRNLGYESTTKKYGLLLYNQYFQSDNLRELEVQLYNDFIIDSVEGSDEWMYEIGIHTPHQSSLYFKMFKDMNLNVKDITYHNDVVDTLRLSYGSLPICDVLLPNSATQDLDNEKFDTFHIVYLDKDGDRMDGTMGRDGNWEATNKEDLFKTIEDLENALIEWFHQMARNFMLDKLNDCKLGDVELISLDEFLIEHKVSLDGSFGENLKIGKQIVSLHDNFKPLEDWYKFGCEPKNMFDDGVEVKVEDEVAKMEKGETYSGSEVRKYLVNFLQNSDKVKEMWLDSEIKNIPNLSFKALQECYSELKEDVMCCNNCGSIVMRS